MTKRSQLEEVYIYADIVSAYSFYNNYKNFILILDKRFKKAWIPNQVGDDSEYVFGDDS